jgi:hypothetical protein
MLLQAKVENIETKNVTLKTGKRAGAVVPVFTVVANGLRIDSGFKCAYRVGDTFNEEITDEPDRWGVYKVVNTATSTGIQPVSAVPTTHSPVKPLPYSPNTTGRSFGFPIPKNDHATSICRQNALTAAVNYANNTALSIGTQMTAVQILELASQFAKWTTGQIEMEEAERILAESTREPNA